MWILIQLVIQLIPSSVEEHGIVVRVIETSTLKTNPDISILFFTKGEDDLLSLLEI